MKKLEPRKARIRTFIIFGLGILVSLYGIARGEQEIIMMTGILIIFSSIIHHVIYYRCPHCGAFLDRNTGDFCPQCGKKVNESE